nr:hypothetical protein [Tanacetum cinerariifolium]
MVDSQPREEEFQGAATRDVGTKTHVGPTEPVLQTQKTPSPSSAFIKENIDSWSQTHTPGRANDVLSYFQLGDEGLCSERTELNSIFITTKPREEEFQGAATRGVGTKTHVGPTKPVLQTQKTPSPSSAFIKENIDVLRTMTKEHDQQAKMKATPRKLAYADSDKEALAESLSRGFSN